MPPTALRLQTDGTEISRDFGLEVVCIILGHNSAAIIGSYSEKDENQSLDIMTRVGWEKAIVKHR